MAVSHVAICGTDSSEWKYATRLTRPPVVLGHEFAGEVAAVGPGVDAFSVGQRIVSGAGVWCGECDWCQAGRTNLCASYYTHGLTVDGALADYVRVPAKTLVPLPDEVPDDAAALAQPFAVAIHAVRRSGVHGGDVVAVIGAGGIGSFIVSALAALEPARIIAIDIDEQRLEGARRLGATETADSTGKELDELILERTAGRGASVVIEASGIPSGPAAALAATQRGGTVMIVGLQKAPTELDLFAAAVREVDIRTTLAHVCQDDLPEAVRLLAQNDLASIVTEQVISLDELVPRGLEPLAAGRARGKTVVDLRRA